MAAEEAGWYEEAAKLCEEEDLMAVVGDRSIFNLDDINLDDIFLDLNDADIPAFGAADNPPQGGLLSSGNLHGSATEDAPMSVDAPPGAGGGVLSEGLLCDDIDVTQLEWLSNFCDESYSSDSLGFIPYNTGDAALHISGDDSENKKMGTNVAAAAGAAKEERNFRSSSPISVLERTGLIVGISPPTSFSTSATTSSSTSSSSSPTSSSCSGTGGGDGDIKMPPEPLIIPARSRSKRPRPASFSPRPPIVIPLPPSSESPALSATSSAPLGSEEHDNFELVAQANQLENAESACPNKSKKKKKKSLAPATTDGKEAAVTSSPAAAARKCMHCEVTKTPQWRAGPMGPKTLCNACGVRYKSGRLFPEYRPAVSPTFVASEHSNSHKKVVEMRNKSVQDTTEMAKPGARRHDVASKACELLEYIRRREWCGDTGIIMSE